VTGHREGVSLLRNERRDVKRQPLEKKDESDTPGTPRELLGRSCPKDGTTGIAGG
jgi:hypothetical protein